MEFCVAVYFGHRNDKNSYWEKYFKLQCHALKFTGRRTAHLQSMPGMSRYTPVQPGFIHSKRKKKSVQRLKKVGHNGAKGAPG